jgi:carboxypeptidase C (cathepsin A)
LPPDPSFYLVKGPYVAAFNDYVRSELKYETTLSYEFLSDQAHSAWKWGSASEGYVNVTDTLGRVISANRNLKVLAAAGLFDLTTPYLTQRYNIEHLGLDPGLQGNITCKFYLAGHQVYTSPSELKKLKEDAASFMKASLVQSSQPPQP